MEVKKKKKMPLKRSKGRNLKNECISICEKRERESGDGGWKYLSKSKSKFNTICWEFWVFNWGLGWCIFFLCILVLSIFFLPLKYSEN